MTSKHYCILSALVWIPYGLLCFLQPAMLASIAGVAATTATGTIELQAMYGGLQIAIGGVAILGLLRPADRLTLVTALGILAAGLGTARLFAMFAAADLSGYTAGGLLFEGLGASVAAWVVSRGE
jgi:hypothetical protein